MAGAVDELVISRGLRAARPPRPDGLVEGIDGSPGRQPDARGVDIGALGLEFLLRGVQSQQGDLPPRRLWHGRLGEEPIVPERRGEVKPAPPDRCSSATGALV